jgi:hypothetical protein
MPTSPSERAADMRVLCSEGGGDGEVGDMSLGRVWVGWGFWEGSEGIRGCGKWVGVARAESDAVDVDE